MTHSHDISEGAAMSVGLIAGIVTAVLLILLVGGVLIARPLVQDSGPRPGPLATQPASGGAPSQGGGTSAPAETRTPGGGGAAPGTTPQR